MDLFLSFKNPILGVIAGAVLTAVLQSSSASVGILQALTSTGAVTYSTAVPIIMGQNIGTTVTALISSAGANKNAKRTAFVHLYFNVIGTILFLCGFYGLNALIGFAFFNDTANTFGIAIVHTIFNVVTTAILLPFNRLLEKLAILTVPDSPSDTKQENTLLDERLLTTPSVAVGRAMLTGSDMAEICRTALLQAMSTTRVWNDAIADEVLRKEDAVDHYEDVLGTYLVKLSAKHLSVEDNRSVNTLLHTIGDFERISDHAVNIIKTAQEIRDKDIKFSEEALNDLSVLEAAVQDIVNRTVDAFQKCDTYAAGKIEPLEQVVDGLVREVKTRHIARLQAGVCTIEYGFVLDDLLTNYERIADHCSNIAVAMIEVAADKFDTHEYLANVKHGGSVKFERRYEKYRGRYTFPPEAYSEPAEIRLKTKNYLPSPMGEGGRGSDRGRMRGSLARHPVTGLYWEPRPSSVRFADSFSLRAKSRLRRLRSDTRLRAQPRGGSLFVGAGHAPPATEKQPPVIGRPRKAAGRACPAPTFIVRGIYYDLHRRGRLQHP